MSQGKIVQCIGAVVDIQFPREAMPKVYDALMLDASAEHAMCEKGLTFEVQQQLGDGVVRTIALGSSDGLRRGMPVNNTGAPISVPVGHGTLGRIMDVLGRPIDDAGGCVRAFEAFRRGAGRDPLFERQHFVEPVSAIAALTVIHPGNHVQLDRLPDHVAAVARDDLVEIVDGVQRGHLSIGPSVIQQHLAATIEERPEVVARGIEDGCIAVHLRHVGGCIERRRIPFGILGDEPAILLERVRERPRAAERRPQQL